MHLYYLRLVLASICEIYVLILSLFAQQKWQCQLHLACCHTEIWGNVLNLFNANSSLHFMQIEDVVFFCFRSSLPFISKSVFSKGGRK